MSIDPTKIDKDSYQPIRKAARAVGKSRDYVRQLVEKGEVLAIRDGGTEEQPWLRVKPCDVEAAMRRLSLYVPKGLKPRQVREMKRASDRSHTGTLHPAIAGMLKRGAKHG